MNSALLVSIVVTSIPLLLCLRLILYSVFTAVYAELFTCFRYLPEAPGWFLKRWTVGMMTSSWSPVSVDTLKGAQEIIRLNKDLGRTFKARLFFGVPILMTSDPAIIKYVMLQRPGNFSKSDDLKRLLRPLLGRDGLFVSEGRSHKRMKRAIMPSFHSHNLLKYSSWFLERADGVANLWLQMAKRSRTPTLIDVFGDMTRMTFDVIVWAVFGRNGTTQEENDHLYEVYKRSMAMQFVDSKGFILMRLFPFIRSLGFTKIAEEMRGIRPMLEVLVRKTRRQLKADTPTTTVKPLIHTLLGDSFSHDESVDNVLTFLGAGQATTAVTLCWLFYEIAKKPRYQEMIRQELKGIQFDPNSGESLAKVNECRMLDNAVKEALRLDPPVCYFVRTVVKENTINGITLPKGYDVRVGIKAMQIDPEIWGADALEFVPERWDRPGENLRERMSWLPFLYGERSCIGNRFAMLEIKACTACVLSRMRLSISEKDPPARSGTSLGIPEQMKIYVEPATPICS